MTFTDLVSLENLAIRKEGSEHCLDHPILKNSIAWCGVASFMAQPKPSERQLSATLFLYPEIKRSVAILTAAFYLTVLLK